MDESRAFAEYMDDLLSGDGYWEGDLVIVPKNLCVAVLSLIQHLTEERRLLPDVLVPSVVRLNNLLGHVLQARDGETS